MVTPTKVRSAAYRARKKVRDSDVLVRLERYERALTVISFLSDGGDLCPSSENHEEWKRYYLKLLHQIRFEAKRALP